MKALVLLSGGLDSAVTLAVAVKEHGIGEVCTFRADLSSRQSCRESAAVECHLKNNYPELYERHMEVPLEMPWLDDHVMYKHDTIVVDSRDPELVEMFAKYSATSVIVPARNAAILGLAGAYAAFREVKNIYVGFDHVGAAKNVQLPPDTSRSTIDSFEAFIGCAAADYNIRVHAPLHGSAKAAIVSVGADLGVDFSTTWSCYNAFDIPCGVCSACSARRLGFVTARALHQLHLPEDVGTTDKLTDPVPYMSKEEVLRALTQIKF